MNEEKIPKSFTLYTDMIPLIKALSAEEAARWIWAVCDYVQGADTESIGHNFLANAFWEQTKIKLKAGLDKAEKRSEDARNAVNTRWQNQRNNTTVYDRIPSNTTAPTIQDYKQKQDSNSTVRKDSTVTDTVTVSVLKNFEDGEEEGESTPAPPAYAGARASPSSPFTFADVQRVADEVAPELTERQRCNFFDMMEKYDWKINGQRVTRLDNALRGYAKKHAKKKPEQDPAPEAAAAPPDPEEALVDLKKCMDPSGSKFLGFVEKAPSYSELKACARSMGLKYLSKDEDTLHKIAHDLKVGYWVQDEDGYFDSGKYEYPLNVRKVLLEEETDMAYDAVTEVHPEMDPGPNLPPISEQTRYYNLVNSLSGHF